MNVEQTAQALQMQASQTEVSKTAELCYCRLINTLENGSFFQSRLQLG